MMATRDYGTAKKMQPTDPMKDASHATPQSFQHNTELWTNVSGIATGHISE
jgi:hypothetical protein